MKVIARLVVLGFSLYIIDMLFSTISITGTGIIILTVLLAFLNATLKPFLQLIGLPLSIITFGIFSLVINALVMQLAFLLSGNAAVNTGGFVTLFFASIILSIVDGFLVNALDLKKK